MRVVRHELSGTGDRQRLIGFARRWLCQHSLIVLRERDPRALIAKSIRRHEASLAQRIHGEVDPLMLTEWHATIMRPRAPGATTQTWLWAAPAKHSTRQIEQMLARFELLYQLGVDRRLVDVPDTILRRYARRSSGCGQLTWRTPETFQL